MGWLVGINFEKRCKVQENFPQKNHMVLHKEYRKPQFIKKAGTSKLPFEATQVILFTHKYIIQNFTLLQPGQHMSRISSNYQCFRQKMQLILLLTLSRPKLAFLIGILFCK